MRKPRKVHVVAALVAACCAWLLASAGAAAAAQQKIAWAKCFGGPFQCGTLQVPLDYDRPNGTTISLGLTRLPATVPTAGSASAGAASTSVAKAATMAAVRTALSMSSIANLLVHAQRLQIIPAPSPTREWSSALGLGPVDSAVRDVRE